MTVPRPVTAYLGLGCNVGTDVEKAAVLRAALREMEAAGGVRIAVASSIYRTPAWGVTEQADFFNAAIAVETTLDARQVLSLAKETEKRLGRTPTYRWGPRLIDIDLLLMEDLVLDEEGLVVPHPRLLERAFVTVPLLEIAPDATLPDGRRIADVAAGGQNGMAKLEPLRA